MSKCLRCGAGSEWLQGKIPDEQVTPSCDNPTTVELKYDPTLEVPQEIIEAAYKIGEWTTRHGWKNWEMGPVADRSALAAERERVSQAWIKAENDTIKQLREQLAAASQREAELLSQRKYLLKALKGSIGYDTWPTKKDLDFARLVITTIDEAIANE